MTAGPAPKEDVAATERQLAGFVERFTPEVAGLIRAARAGLRARMPGAVELVYDNYNALAIGFGASERTSEAIVSLACYARGVLLYFVQGASLADPDRILLGQGSRGRHVRLPDVAVLWDPRVETMLARAVAASPRPLPPGGGYTVVKSISARQRPRRPSGD